MTTQSSRRSSVEDRIERCWLATHPDEMNARVAINELVADHYRRNGWELVGPFVPESYAWRFVKEVGRLKGVIRRAHNDLNDPENVKAVMGALWSAIVFPPTEGQ
jgi:hypothetical protein